MSKKIFKCIGITIGILILAGALFIGFLTVVEYRPEDITQAIVVSDSAGGSLLSYNDSFEVMTWNIGYGALGKNSDFALDGGSGHDADKETALAYVNGIEETVKSFDDVDFCMYQEIDRNSTRSFKIDEISRLSKANEVFANNFKCIYVPFPFPPMGTVDSGLATTSDYEIDNAKRISLPCTFKWPIRIANLKRCMLVSYIPIEGKDNSLVLVNVHLEAYDKGDAKKAQIETLMKYIEEEYEAGNYVLVGGDFNACFPDSEKDYPLRLTDDFIPSKLDDSMLPEGFRFGFDISKPSCRLLNQPYNPEDTQNTQYYVLDGFIVSDNLEIENVETVDCDFVNSDHNPVIIRACFKD